MSRWSAISLKPLPLPASRWFAWSLFVATALPNAALLDAAEKAAQTATAAPVVWKLDDLKQVGGQTPLVEGAPTLLREVSGTVALRFDGKADALVLPVNPVAGFSQFTVEILFSPAADGGAEQRFFHVQDEAGRRILMEIRLNKEGLWWFDTFLKPATIAGLTLIDPKKTHPAGQWYWVALRYDGKHMSSFVNGETELEGDVAFEPMGAGQTSVGVRLNRVFWFKGAISEVRLHPAAIAPENLQRAK